MMSTTRALRVACMLLLLAQVTCDWVEIEQDRYKPERKPMVGSKLRESNEESQLEEALNFGAADNKRNEDKKWSKGVVDRVTNVGNIRRVQTPSVKTTGIKLDHAGSLFSKNVSHLGEADRSKFRNNTNTANHHFFTEKSSIVSLRPNQDNTGIKSIEETLDRLKSDVDKYEEKETSVNKLNKNNIYQMQRFHKPPSKNEGTKVFVRKESIKNDFDDNFQIIKVSHTRTSPRPNVFNTRAPTTKKIQIFHRIRTTEEPLMQNHDNIKYAATNFTITKPSTHSRMKISIATEKTTNFKILNTNPPKTLETKILPLEKNEDEELPTEGQSNSTENATNDKNENKMDGMLKLMKVVSDIIYKNTHRSFKGKVVYLEGLKSTLLTTIEDHIDKLWPDDSDRSRQVREARGHLEFPSSESALMTISFLTFAVFLIKLVLQVIHTYKNKTMMVTPTVVAAVGRVAREMRSKQ